MNRFREGFVEWQERFGGSGVSAGEGLRRAKAAHGVVRADDVRRVAGELGWPVAAVSGTASFYADFAGGGQGRRHVRVCEGTSCFVSTLGRHIDRLEVALGVGRGDRAPDGSVSLQVVHCLGYCYASPAALDGRVPRAGPALDGLLTEATGGARTTRQGIRSELPDVSDGAPPVPYQNASSRAVLLAGLIGEEGAWEAWPEALAAGAERVIAEVGAAGLRGRGGAEFPVTVKWSAAAAGPAPRYVVANGDEGDPGSFCDRLLMEGDPHRVLEGLALAGFAVGAARGVVLVRSEYPAALARMRTAVTEARASGHLGADVHGSGFGFDVEVVEGAGSYVAGEETALLHLLQGLRGSARARPPYPTSRGVGGRPTAVNNVETLAAVPWIVRHGGAAYRRLGLPDEPGTKLVCLSERFRRPGVYEVEFGVPLRLIVEDLGGGLREGRTLRAVQIGGPLGGFLSPAETHVPLSAGALAEAGVALGHGSLVAVDTDVPAGELLRHVWSFAASESCGACVPCRVGSRRGLELAERIAAAPAGQVDAALATQERVAQVMQVGSLCAFGRNVPGSVRSLVRVYRDDLESGAS
ncbi:NAD(P)H-dependent oxidoreductase subunit E [Actinomadura scrupuli]|uniref:NAD(P)H-dependent oxidoreductase subunit E n=1 Tax=Actinomadura scrupuli TaxID=559629 RepID=UPI003D99EFFB